MKINELFNSKKLVFSFEIFPPKVTSSINTIYETLEELKDLKPDFISVTYGAGGSLTNNRTTELSSVVKGKYGAPRIVGVVLNFLLLADMACMMVSSVMISRDVFCFLDIGGGEFGRRSAICRNLCFDGKAQVRQSG